MKKLNWFNPLEGDWVFGWILVAIATLACIGCFFLIIEMLISGPNDCIFGRIIQ
jgi:hypothetical protein